MPRETGPGEVSDAVVRKATGDLGEIAFVYGDDTGGLRHIQLKHGDDMLARVPEILRKGSLIGKRTVEVDGKPRDVTAFIQAEGDPPPTAVIRLDFDGVEKRWLVKAFDDEQGQVARQLQISNVPTASASTRIPDATGQKRQMGNSLENQGLDSEGIAALRADFGDIELDLPDSTKLRGSEARRLFDEMVNV